MMGVNLYNIDSLVKKCQSYSLELSANLKKMSININALTKVYEGTGINHLFLPITQQLNSINSITGVIDSYSSTLMLVKASYQNQDLYLKTRTKNMVSKNFK